MKDLTQWDCSSISDSKLLELLADPEISLEAKDELVKSFNKGKKQFMTNRKRNYISH